MKMYYIVSDPTGNITVLIRSPYSEDNRAQLIREAFELESDCEQVGFIVPARSGQIGLEMMGYEFCGNASLSACALYAYEKGLLSGSEMDVLLDSSGVSDTLNVRIRRLEDTSDGHPAFSGSIMMPLPSLGSFSGYPVVHMDGISHLLIPTDKLSDREAEALIKEYAAELNVPALGMILYSFEDDPHAGTGSAWPDVICIRPLVYVRDSDTLVWEHGCATGSTAIGYYRYCSENLSESSTDIKQPGGTIRIRILNGHPELTANVVLRKI